MRIAVILFLVLSVVSALPHPEPQNFLSEIKSALGFGDDDKTTSASSSRTLIAATSSSAFSRPTLSTSKSASAAASSSSSSSSSSSATPSRTRTSQSTDISSSTQSTSTSSSSSTITSEPTPTSTPASSTTIPAPAITSTASAQPTSSNNVSGGGIAAAVIMTLAVVLAIGWLLFRYHPGIRRRWLAHQEKKMQERSYRDAIDGPFARTGGSGVRSQALGSMSSRKSTLASFFAPRTANLGNGKEIRRKPVNWGATDDTPPPVPELPGSGMEKVPLTNMAAPMARSESLVSSMSYQHSHSGGLGSAVSSPTTVGGGGTMIGNSGVPSPTAGHKELPAIPMPSSSLSPYRPMPPIPPVPPVPEDPKRDMHKILSRKSIFELA